MGRAPCCDEDGIKKGPWTPEEDQKLVDFIQRNGHGSWRALPKLAGLNRCGKSCRLRWTNYLRPDIKRGRFSDEEEQIIIKLHSHMGNKWSAIATRLPGRTDNEIKNYWNTHLKKKLLQMGIDPVTHKPRTDLNHLLGSITHLLMASNLGNLMNPWDSALMDAAQLAKMQWLQSLLSMMTTSNNPPNMEAMNLMGSPAFTDRQISEFLRSNCQLNGLLDGSLGVAHDLMPMQSNFSDLGTQQLPCLYQALDESCASLEGQEASGAIDGSGSKAPNYNINHYTTDNNHMVMSSCGGTAPGIPTQTLFSSSSEIVKAEAVQDHVNPTEISTRSSASTTFEGWGELNLDDQASDYCWADIIE
ncbi:hypothetical protein AAC387_Pa08g2088 [Persea americana]